MLRVECEIKVTEVVAGTKYNAQLRFEQTTLPLEVTIPIPFKELEPAESSLLQDVRRVIKIALCQADQRIELEDDEYELFFMLIGSKLLDLLYFERTLESNRGTIGKERRRLDPFAASREVSIRSLGDADISEEIVDILRRQKFGFVPTV